MADADEASEPIVWSSGGRSRADRDLERDVRVFCERDARVSPELAHEALFWLDLGREPRDVAHWLREELENGPRPDPPTPDEHSLFPHEERGAGTAPTAGWKRKRTRGVRRLFSHRTAS